MIGLEYVCMMALAGSPEAAVATEDPVRTSIAFIGCNRVGWGGEHHPSTANVAQLLATFEDIAAMDPAPEFLFFCGDLVRNEEDDDGQTLESQLQPWQDLFAASALHDSSTTLVPITGNHEVLLSRQDKTGGYIELPNPPTYPIWVAWCEEHGHDQFAGNGPGPGGEDLLALDESKLTYSFDSPAKGEGRIHFIVIDTDAMSTAVPEELACYQEADFTGDGENPLAPVPGWIAVHWIEQDLAAAEADAGIDMIFALGHKPIEAFGETDPTGRSSIMDCSEYPMASQLRNAFASSSKFKGYLASHVHLWDAANLASNEEATATWQVIAGNGGSQLDDRWEPRSPWGAATEPFYGFSVVRIHESGRTFVDSYGRAVPDPYDADELTDAQRQTTLRNEVFLGVPCEGDVNRSGSVTVIDLLYVLINFWNTDGVGDANGDGVTNVTDLLYVLDHYGDEC
jgi:hypothetical protein